MNFKNKLTINQLTLIKILIFALKLFIRINLW